MNALIIHHHQQNHLQSLSMNLINRHVQPPLGFHTLSTELMLIAEIWRDSASIVCDGRYGKLAAVGNFPGLLGFCFYSYGYSTSFVLNWLPHRSIPVRKNNKLVFWRLAFPNIIFPLLSSPERMNILVFMGGWGTHHHLYATYRHHQNHQHPVIPHWPLIYIPLWCFKSPNSSQFSLKKKNMWLVFKQLRCLKGLKSISPLRQGTEDLILDAFGWRNTEQHQRSFNHCNNAW